MKLRFDPFSLQRKGLRPIVQNGIVQFLHSVKQITMEMKAYLFPKRSLSFPFLPSCLEQRTAHLLNLVYQEGQHHKQDKYLAEVFFPESEIMTKVTLLIFQGTKSLILDLPSSTGTAHKPIDIFFGDRQVDNPTEI